jgi:hypothetical protein
VLVVRVAVPRPGATAIMLPLSVLRTPPSARASTAASTIVVRAVSGCRHSGASMVLYLAVHDIHFSVYGAMSYSRAPHCSSAEADANHYRHLANQVTATA